MSTFKERVDYALNTPVPKVKKLTSIMAEFPALIEEADAEREALVAQLNDPLTASEVRAQLPSEIDRVTTRKADLVATRDRIQAIKDAAVKRDVIENE